MATSIPEFFRADRESIALDRHKIKALRQALGISQAEAARRAEMSGRQTWYHIEQGRLGNITLDTLDKIARALGVEPRDLLK